MKIAKILCVLIFLASNCWGITFGRGGGAVISPGDMDTSSNSNFVIRSNLNTLTTQTITADSQSVDPSGIYYANQVHVVNSDSGSIDLLSNPQIVAGNDGQIVWFCGDSDTNFIILDDGNGVATKGAASINLTSQTCLLAQYRTVDSAWVEIIRVSTSNVGGTDTQVVYIDGTTPTGDSGLTYNKTTKILTVTGGITSNCDPATDADACDTKAVLDDASPDSPDSGGVDLKFVDNGTDARLEYIADGYALKSMKPDRLVTVTTSATITLTNEECSRDASITNNDADALLVNLCASPRIGSIVCVKDAAGGVITLNPDNSDVIIWAGTAESAGDAIVSSGVVGEMACVEAITTGVWLGEAGGVGTWTPE